MIARRLETFRLAVVLSFVALCGVFFAWLWASGGGTIPGITHRPQYTVSFLDDDVLNLVKFGEVRVAGVLAGRVESIEPDGPAKLVTIGLDSQAAPLHKGVQVRVGIRSLEGPSYVDVKDGVGPTIASGGVLPPSSVAETVDLRAVLAGLDPGSRARLGSMVRSLGMTVDGTSTSVGQLAGALGSIGSRGHNVIDAVSAQSSDMKSLVQQANTLVDALDTGQGELASLVSNAHQLTRATAENRDGLSATMAKLPETLRNASTASDKINELNSYLHPIVSDILAASPDINSVLERTPSLTGNLRGSTAPLDETLDELPATLHRVPSLSDDLQQAAPVIGFEMRDLNPMFAYLRPYGMDAAAAFSNFSAAFVRDENGVPYLRLQTVFNEATLKEMPVKSPNQLPVKYNPYPAPGGGRDLRPFVGNAPRVERLPN